MEGLLFVDKPESWTSFDVVNYVRKIVATAEGKKPRNVKVGHSGTLDPAATGLLMLAIGKKYTSQMPSLMKKDKLYEVELCFGKVSTTGDKEGKLEDVSASVPTKDDILRILDELQGEIEQIPPAFSAIKVDGKRAYDLARAGKEVILHPRLVTIHSNTFTSYEYPLLRFTSHVSSGTYIRTLVEDIGKKLGCGAYMSNLRRTAIGEHNIQKACTVSTLDIETIQKSLVNNR